MRNSRISDPYHIHYEKNRLWENTTWMGVPMWKLPNDAMIIQELIWKIKPDLIIETGTGRGGSALFYASILYCIGSTFSKVLTIDTDSIDQSYIPDNLFDKIMFYRGQSIDPDIISAVKEQVRISRRIMVLLDSWHSEEYVLQEIDVYSKFVTLDSYLIVEDTHVNDNPVPWDYGNGPMGAVNTFLEKNNNFEIDKNCEKLVMTFNPNGYLKRIG